MIIEQSDSHGFTVYKFTANSTDYEILTRDGVQFDVYSSRHGLSGRTPPKCYDTPADLASRSKTFARFVQLLEV